ncbi:MAG: TrkH family potassium uptake protein [Clostridiales Family XIII bacterium]|jgi:trk system potassium uptake protein TrkH|nr:TrkH family potassium uptake protein [Clostridiales Family XIII bacterium]
MNLNHKLILKVIGMVCLIIGGAMLPCFVASLIFGEYGMTSAFGVIIAAQLIAGAILVFGIRNVRPSIRVRDGLLVVAMCWLLASVLGALPYVVSGEMDSFVDGFFESVSSFTTSGATLLSNLAEMPNSLLLWRSLSNWIGGMGILIFAISILPALGMGAANIMNAETTAPTIDKVKSRMSDNAKHLYLIYFAFTAIEFVLLMFSGEMSPYDALIHAFGSMANGGLSNYADGVHHFNSLYIEIVVAIFCVLAAMNFISYQLIFRRRFRDFFKEPEIRVFFIILFGVMILTIFILNWKGVYDSLGETIRYGFFQVVSFVTTAGYASTDYGAWPGFCKMLMFAALFVGGCSASTSGGLKIIRFSVILALIRRNVYKRLHPNAVVAVKLGEKPISADRVSNITVYVFVYMLVFAVGSLILSFDGLSVTTTTSAVIAALSNIGLAFGQLEYNSTYEIFSAGGRLLLSLLMLIGRLELFTIILLFTPTFWRPDR